MIFQNSLTRIYNWMHMFYLITKYPNLTIENMLSRSEYQLNQKSRIDKTNTKKNRKKPNSPRKIPNSK